jgi:uncharacterized protein YkwD
VRVVVRGLLVLVAFALVFAPPAAGATPLERDLVREMNRVRSVHGRAPLRVDAVLTRAASAHSEDMLARSRFSHGKFAERMRRFGARSPLLGENLAWASGANATAAAIVRMWMRSPGHRANLLRRSFRRIGVAARTGTMKGVEGAVVVTADFGG